jgi:fructokinase
MNEAELDLITGWFSPFKKIEDRINLIQEKFNIETLIVTMGGDGAVLNDKGNIYRHSGFKVKVADTIGSGDSFLAGYIKQISNGATAEDALAYASCIGAFIATQPGACPAYELSQITQLFQSQSQKQIKTLL